MFRKEGLPVFFKRILLFVLVLAAAVFQNTDGFLPSVFGARLFVLIPVIISIGMFEGELSGLLYGLAGGAFWDVCASGLDGFHGLFLALTGLASGLLVRFIMRNKLLTQYCICIVASALYSVLYWYMTVAYPIGDSGSRKLLTFYLPAAVMTCVFSFIPYFIIKAVTGAIDSKKQEV